MYTNNSLSCNSLGYILWKESQKVDKDIISCKSIRQKEKKSESYSSKDRFQWLEEGQDAKTIEGERYMGNVKIAKLDFGACIDAH